MCQTESPAFMSLNSKENSLANPGALHIITGGVGAVEKNKKWIPGWVV